MRVIVPVPLTDAALLSSTAPEPGVGEGGSPWSAATTYAEGDVAILASPASEVDLSIAAPCVVDWPDHGLPNGTPVVLTNTGGALPAGLTEGQRYFIIKRTADTFQLAETREGAPIVTTGSQSGAHTATAEVHRAYESLISSNTGNPPAIDDGTKWLELGPTSRWAALDLARNTRTWRTSSLQYVVAPGRRVNSLAVLGIVGDEITVAYTSSAGSDSETVNLITRNVTNWYDHFFSPFEIESGYVTFDLPPFTDIQITVTVTRAVGQAAIASIVPGNYADLGRAQHGAQSDTLNFSKVERDEFGNAELVKRRNVPKTSQTVWVDKTEIPKLLAAREALNAEPAVWTTLDQDDNGYFNAFLVSGIYTRWVISAEHADKAVQSIELEEI